MSRYSREIANRDVTDAQYDFCVEQWKGKKTMLQALGVATDGAFAKDRQTNFH
jgi:hypothetical protein